jgi:hypothetical protein
VGVFVKAQRGLDDATTLLGLALEVGSISIASALGRSGIPGWGRCGP